LFVLIVLIFIGLIAAAGISAFIENQKMQHAQEAFEHATGGAGRIIVAQPSPAAPPPPPPQAPRYAIAVLKRPITFQLPHGNVTLPRGSQLMLVSRNESEVRVSYRGQQQSVPASDVDLR
jgi:hypothetical protein